MARHAQGWRLDRDPRTGVYFARFTHASRRYKLSTGARDPGEAESAAARRYADVIAGRRAPGRQVAASPNRPLDEVAAAWLADVEPTLDPTTFKLYQNTYVGGHFAPFFRTMDRVSTVGIEEYKAHRLRQVRRETLKKELHALTRFVKWAYKRGHLSELPLVELPPRHVAGTTASQSRKRKFLVFTEAEIEAVLARLPEWTESKKKKGSFPVRARFIVAWETGLRPSTLCKLCAPGDYRRGDQHLVIREEADKADFGRELPLTSARERRSTRCAPTQGSSSVRTTTGPFCAAPPAMPISTSGARRSSATTTFATRGRPTSGA
jgi:hypothetical protein